MKSEITVVSYNPEWPVRFNEERLKLEKIFGTNQKSINHIGSTSVVGLAAKPIIDILAVVCHIDQIDSIVNLFEDIGYAYEGEFGIPGRRYFRKRNKGQDFNLHVYEQEAPQVIEHLAFRDYLRNHPEDCLTYAEIKKDLAHKFPCDMDAYCEGKDKFIKNIIKKAKKHL